MIISHRYKFIFIKNRKVGSTSTERALHAICGPEDVLTPDHLHSGEEDVLAPLARNYGGRFNPLRELTASRRPLEAARVLRDAALRPRFYNHMRASSVRARIPRGMWDSYYKFCFERNPWDKVISYYYWVGRSRQLPDFDTFLREGRGQWRTADQTLPSDWTRYTLHDRVIVDDVFDYADLAGGVDTALARAGVPEEVRRQVQLSREKGSLRKRTPPAFSQEADAVIRRAFAREIETFDFCSAPPGWLTAKPERQTV
jgi:hypothetical protein